MQRLRARSYRGVTAAQGGPIVSSETGLLTVCGRSLFHVNVWLAEGLVPRRPLMIFGSADGSGTHSCPRVAHQIAISEALERWAYFSAKTAGARQRHGFDVDPTSNGMAAYPGPRATRAREAALMEAVERFSILAWWEGCAEARWVQTDWPGIEALAIEGPFGGITVIVIGEPGEGGRAYGQAAASTFTAAFEKAMIELSRNRWLLASADALGPAPADLPERRMRFFATEEGYSQVCERVSASVGCVMPRVGLACDDEIPGPWSRFGTVWRSVFYPPSRRFLEPREDYFFW